MTTRKALGRGDVATSDRAGQVVINRHTLNVEVRASGDIDIIGSLPAFHRLVPELSSIVFDEDCPAATVDVDVGGDTNKIVSAKAHSAGSYDRAALSTFELCETLGVSDANRDVYIKYGAAVATAGGTITLVLASFASAT